MLDDGSLDLSRIVEIQINMLELGLMVRPLGASISQLELFLRENSTDNYHFWWR